MTDLIGKNPGQIAALTNIEHRYGKQVALRGVGLDLHRGELVGVIGPDGVGKSTLLGILAGAKRIQIGRAEVLGGDLADRRHRSTVCPRIAYMPQGLGRNLYPDLTVEENMVFFASLFNQDAQERKQRIDVLMEATGLTPFAGRAARNLSGGMRQKLGLCCSLIHDPDLLILDEPTTGVDPLSRRQFWELVNRMRAMRPGMCVIVATAYMEEAEGFERLVAMNDGSVLAAGTPSEIRRRTGCKTLEESFIALLPQALRAHRVHPDIPPRHLGSHDIAISARHLTKRFGDFVAVDDVSFEIERGEIFGFLGSNGCGKTTTMKMLTGLLPATTGEAQLFGRPIDATDIAMRTRVGYMSQSFSLYTELTVRQNLALHARLYHISPERARQRIAELVSSFLLEGYLDEGVAGLPLGIRQRLALAVAVVHDPELLILDEPTSGVDPLARDLFWALLGDLARNHGVTIFISTHFMNEAARCDRISLMNAGHVLATGSPAELSRQWGGGTLEEAFIACLEAATGGTEEHEGHDALPVGPPDSGRHPRRPFFSLRRLFAYSLREFLELRRDPIRLSFAVLGPAILLLVFGYGINTDVDHIAFAVYDRDQTPESRFYLNEFRGSHYYFAEYPPIADPQDLRERLMDGKVKVVLDVPAGFGRDVRRGNQTEVGAWVDGVVPFRGETIRGYVQSVHDLYLQDLARYKVQATANDTPVTIQTRFRYNQSFDSVNALVPADIALLLVLVPAILMALAVVREKELGSIVNLYVTPVSRLEFILGKQLPYVALAMVAFALLIVMAILLFGVPIRGSLLTLVCGTLIYVFATTSFGLLISAFSTSQIAALFGTAILTIMPATQFSGMLSPMSSLSGMGTVIGHVFPMSYYLPISVGTFTKALGFAGLNRYMVDLSLCVLSLLALSLALLRKQER